MSDHETFHGISDFEDCINWNNTAVTSLAFHFLAVPCPNNNNTGFEKAIEAPATFFVQLARLSFCLTFIIIVLALYNSIEVLGRTVFSIASCSLHWVLFYGLIFCKSLVLIIMVPVLTRSMVYSDNQYNILSWCKSHINNYTYLNLSGFLIITLLQYATTIILFCSLEHEFKFRTSEYASVEAPLSRRCGSLKKLKLYLTWPRLVILCIGAVSLILLMSIEITLGAHHQDSKCQGHQFTCTASTVPSSLVWVWLSSVIIMRLGVVLMGMGLLLIRHESLRLTPLAKVYLVIALLLSLMEDIPNSVLTIANDKYNNSEDKDLNVNCLGHALTSFDICQLLGGLSLIAFLLFIRSQYLRVEQESKLTVVWDMQRLLQVNGRKDYRTH